MALGFHAHSVCFLPALRGLSCFWLRGSRLLGVRLLMRSLLPRVCGASCCPPFLLASESGIGVWQKVIDGIDSRRGQLKCQARRALSRSAATSRRTRGVATSAGSRTASRTTSAARAEARTWGTPRAAWEVWPQARRMPSRTSSPLASTFAREVEKFRWTNGDGCSDLPYHPHRQTNSTTWNPEAGRAVFGSLLSR